MGENFNFNGRIGADVADLVPAQLTAQDNAGHAPGGAELDAVQIVDGQLGGAVEGDMGCDFPALLNDAQILHDESIHTGGGGIADQFAQFAHFPVGDQGVQGQMNFDATDVAVFYCLSQGLRGKVFCALSCVKGTDAQVNGVCTILYRRFQRIHRTSRGQ